MTPSSFRNLSPAPGLKLVKRPTPARRHRLLWAGPLLLAGGGPCFRWPCRCPGLGSTVRQGWRCGLGGHGCGSAAAGRPDGPIAGPWCCFPTACCALAGPGAGAFEKLVAFTWGTWRPADSAAPGFSGAGGVLSLLLGENLWVLIRAAGCGPAGAAEGGVLQLGRRPGSAAGFRSWRCCWCWFRTLILCAGLQSPWRTGSFRGSKARSRSRHHNCGPW